MIETEIQSNFLERISITLISDIKETYLINNITVVHMWGNVVLQDIPLDEENIIAL